MLWISMQNEHHRAGAARTTSRKNRCSPCQGPHTALTPSPCPMDPTAIPTIAIMGRAGTGV